MRNILRIYGTPILNFWDLQQNFSPMELYGQLETFTDFSEIHLVPLPVILESEESGERYPAKEFTKEFWYQILRSTLCDEEYDASEEFSDLVREEQEEAEDAELLQKLDFIRRKFDKGNEYKEALVILAICELSEVDPRKTEWVIRPNPDAASDRTDDGRIGRKGKTEITYFPYENTASLVTGETYRYWYYDEETLPEGTLIQTVKVSAVGGANRYVSVWIELYNEKSGLCIGTLELRAGEYKYCTVTHGRIIEFLPNISLSDDFCLIRSDYSSSTLSAKPRRGESWNVDGENVSSFSAGTLSQGFLLVRNGRLNYQFYKNITNYHTKLQLEMIIIPAVGVKISEKGFEVLLEDGTVVSDQIEKRRAHEVSLNPWNRFPYPNASGAEEYRESVASDSGKSWAALTKDKGNEVIQFG